MKTHQPEASSVGTICRRHQWARTRVPGVLVCVRCNATNREQTAQHALPAPPHRAGHHPGLYDESQPYTTTTRPARNADMLMQAGCIQPRTRYQQPPPNEYERDDDDSRYGTRRNTSVVVRHQPYDIDATHVWETEEPPRQRRQGHPLFYLGMSILIAVVFIAGFTYIPPAWQNHVHDVTYGYPRTYQTDANVGHGGLSHFIVVNSHGTIEVLELPADLTKTKPQLYLITGFKGDGADRIPATVSFPDVNQDGKPAMQVAVYNGAIPTIWTWYNDGTTFKPHV